jgi:glycerate 2-kinase
MSNDLRKTAREIFTNTLHQLDIAKAMHSRVRCSKDSLQIEQQIFPLANFRRIILIAIGKASIPMVNSLLSQIGPALSPNRILQGIAVGPPSAHPINSAIRFFPGDHPLPGVTSRIVAEEILHLLRSCDETCLVFFLISGGASAMVEKPLDDQISLEEVTRFHQSLVHSGLPISKMNVLRKHFSQVKGGRLAVAAQGATQCTLLISDVPRGASHIVGSGPSLPDPSTIHDCHQIIEENSAALKLSPRVLEFFSSPDLEETPKAHHPAFDKADYISLLSSEDLCTFAGEAAREKGFHVIIDNTCDDWDYRGAAAHLLDHLQSIGRHHARVCLLSAGEISVQVPSQHGVGGRNQHFVLECARLLEERHQAATVLSAGSDGIDGNSAAAGAVCDETSIARALAQGMDIISSLERFDSANVFNALGDQIITGPTGSNVRDLRILLGSN